MKALKVILPFFILSLFMWSCSSVPKKIAAKKEQPVVIANDSLQYEITIIDPGFNTYLHSVARPMDFYSVNYLETKNKFFVIAWNERARNPMRYNSKIYENEINYDSSVHYGLEVNYKLYWYFKFAERKYRMKLN